jgi:hypothetical protein
VRPFATVASGIAALAPIAGFATAFFVSQEWFPTLVTAVVVGGWLITFAFMAYALASSAVPKPKRGLWAAVLFFGNMFAVPFFWFWYIRGANDRSMDTGT